MGGRPPREVNKWGRRFVLTGVIFLVVWQLSVLTNFPRRTTVSLGIFGFILHVILGKGYTLIPSYFHESLKPKKSPFLTFPLTVFGAILISIAPAYPLVNLYGSLIWSLGILIFFGSITWSVRENPTGKKTENSNKSKKDLEPVDNFANPFMLIALLYIILGSLWFFISNFNFFSNPFIPQKISHFLAAGGGALLLFSVGFRLLPRFLGSKPSLNMARITLPTGAIGPLLISIGLPIGSIFQLGAAIEAIAVTAFMVEYIRMLYISKTKNIGFYSIAIGVLSGFIAILIGLHFAFTGQLTPTLVTIHYRLNLVGFLGLSIIGVTYRFYPPTIGNFFAAKKSTAIASVSLITIGLYMELFGVFQRLSILTKIGQIIVLTGCIIYAYLILGLTYEKSKR